MCPRQGFDPCGSIAAAFRVVQKRWPDPALAQELLRTEIDKAFDAFAGDLPPTLEYSGSFYQGLDIELGIVYQRAGIDLQDLAASGRANELTEEILLEHSTDIYVDPEGTEMDLLNWLQARGRMAVGHIEYTYFLKGVNIDSQNWMNFEPNYLDAMMRAHPSDLRDAKDAYMADIQEVHGHDAREALRWMQTRVEAVGTE